MLAAMLCLVLASCKFERIASLNDGRMIEPSSNIVKNEYRLSAFDQVDIDVVANVKFIQGSEGDYRVVLSCPENYVELFQFDVDGTELGVEFTRDRVNIEAKHVDITIYAPTLRQLENGGVASVEVDRLTTDRLEVENSGVGSLYLSGLTVRQMDAECSGVGNVELSGTADEARLECSGVGSIKAERLTAKAVRADVSGVGGVSCHATESIDADVSGVGSLRYGGKPQRKNLNRTGVGKITEM